MGADAYGNLYAVGTSGNRFVTRKSATGTSWTTVDSYYGTTGSAQANAFAADSYGNLFVVGYAQFSNGYHWVVRESVAGTGTWTTVDNFQYVAGHIAAAKGIVADTAGQWLPLRHKKPSCVDATDFALPLPCEPAQAYS